MKVLLLSLLGVVWAETCVGGVDIAVFSGPEAQMKCISSVGWPGFQIIEAHVVVTGDVPLRSVSFTSNVTGAGNPLAECEELLQWLGDSSVFPQTSGTSPTGVQIDFGECLTPPVHVLTFNILSMGLRGCCLYCVHEAQAIDCSGQPVPVVVSCTRAVPGSCDFSVPTGPLPPDGARNVSLDAKLGWTSTGAYGCALGEIVGYMVHFGTTVDPPMVGYDVGAPFDPGESVPLLVGN